MAKLKVYLGGNFCFFLYLSEYLTILVNMHMFEGQALQKKKMRGSISICRAMISYEVMNHIRQASIIRWLVPISLASSEVLLRANKKIRKYHHSRITILVPIVRMINLGFIYNNTRAWFPFSFPPVFHLCSNFLFGSSLRPVCFCLMLYLLLSDCAWSNNMYSLFSILWQVYV